MKDLTTPLEIAQFFIDCAINHGIKTSVSKSITDAKVKVVTINITEEKICNN